MAEETGQERNERPTAKRLTKARDDGQIPRSQELSSAVVVLAGATSLAVFGGSAIGLGMQDMMREMMSALGSTEFTEVGAASLIRTVARGTMVAMLPFLLAIVVPALLVNAVQARGVLSLKPVTPDFSRVNPLAGLGRLVSMQAVFTLLKAIAKVAIIATIGYMALSDAWPRIAALSGADANAVLAVARSTSTRLVLFSCLGFVALSMLDYGFSMWQHDKKLRMTRQEIVQEFRESEGDPILKSRMRSLAQSLIRKRMLHRVKDADVVIVNPTSIAVAIRYDGNTSPAPIVLAMGRRKLAQRIVELARAADVPVVQNIPVARALMASAAIGKPIPPALYAAVAEVLAFVYRQWGRMPKGLAEVRVA